jgi:hypothetical protein
MIASFETRLGYHIRRRRLSASSPDALRPF